MSMREILYGDCLMKGIILCGGNGTRLFPLTKVTNKHLLPVYNKPMIYYPLNTLIKSGIKEIMIVSGRHHCGHFLELLGSGEDFGVKLSYTVQDKAGGIAHALGLCKGFIDGNDIACILGDNIFEQSFNLSNFREGARIYLKRVENPERFGVAKFDIKTIPLNNLREKEEWILREIIEKPDIDKIPSNYAVTGLYLYDNSVFDIISCLKPSSRGELEITDVNNNYIKEGKMEHEVVTGFWTDAGGYESLYRATTYIRNKVIEIGD